VTTGDDMVEVLVETPQGSRKKYEYDHERHAMRLDRRLFSATIYPADYGFIPDTEGQDGEALDALVLTQEPTFPGCWVTARVIGLVWIAYDGEREAKILAVPVNDPTWNDVHDLDDLPEHLRDEIGNFFDVYKELEPGRTPTPDGYEGREAALTEIGKARERKASAAEG
jgi:inorganic pyrophosphatase